MTFQNSSMNNLSLSAFKKLVQEIKFPGIEYKLQRFVTEQRELRAEMAALKQKNEDLMQENIRLVNHVFKLDAIVKKSLLDVRAELRAEFSQSNDDAN